MHITNKNTILDTDSYKLSHYAQYDPSVQSTSAYISTRGVSDNFPKTDKHVFFGLQAWIKENLDGRFIRSSMIDEAKLFAEMHGEPFNTEGWNGISSRGGYVPVEIQALEEGSIVPIKTPVVQVVSTDPENAWVANSLETSLQRGVWYPSMVSTLSYLMKQKIGRYWQLTVDEENWPGLEFALHDFGGRGATSFESAGIGGMAHLVNFKGSDTITGILFAKNYYGGSMAGFSVPAAEHSTATSWGRAREVDFVSNMIDRFGGPGKIYSVIGDTYDIYNFVDNIVTDFLLKKIINKGGRFVIRPDSGDPEVVLSKILGIFEKKNMFSLNKKGYKVLPDYFRILWGDGINYYSAGDILDAMIKLGWSAENFVFGMGGALLQKLDRDGLKWSMKLNAVDRGYGWEAVSKDPITDPGKASMGGYVQGIPVVWRNGYWNRKYDDFNDIRARVAQSALMH